MDESQLAYVDIETTGLDPERHVPWEIGLIVDGQEYRWLLALTDDDIRQADPIALDIGGFHERHPQGNRFSPSDVPLGGSIEAEGPRSAAGAIGRLTHGRHLVGAVVSFDADRLVRLFARNGVKPGWHYHLIDVEGLAVGFVMGRYGISDEAERSALALPWKSEELSRCVGVEPDAFEKHTALGDARWARMLYQAVMARAETSYVPGFVPTDMEFPER